MQAALKATNVPLSKQQHRLLMRHLDVNRDGFVAWDEFRDYIAYEVRKCQGEKMVVRVSWWRERGDRFKMWYRGAIVGGGFERARSCSLACLPPQKNLKTLIHNMAPTLAQVQARPGIDVLAEDLVLATCSDLRLPLVSMVSKLGRRRVLRDVEKWAPIGMAGQDAV